MSPGVGSVVRTVRALLPYLHRKAQPRIGVCGWEVDAMGWSRLRPDSARKGQIEYPYGQPRPLPIFVCSPPAICLISTISFDSIFFLNARRICVDIFVKGSVSIVQVTPECWNLVYPKVPVPDQHRNHM